MSTRAEPEMMRPMDEVSSAIMQLGTSELLSATASTLIVGGVARKRLENGSGWLTLSTTRTMLLSPVKGPAVGGVSIASIV